MAYASLIGAFAATASSTGKVAAQGCRHYAVFVVVALAIARPQGGSAGFAGAAGNLTAVGIAFTVESSRWPTICMFLCPALLWPLPGGDAVLARGTQERLIVELCVGCAESAAVGMAGGHHRPHRQGVGLSALAAA